MADNADTSSAKGHSDLTSRTAGKSLLQTNLGFETSSKFKMWPQGMMDSSQDLQGQVALSLYAARFRCAKARGKAFKAKAQSNGWVRKAKFDLDLLTNLTKHSTPTRQLTCVRCNPCAL